MRIQRAPRWSPGRMSWKEGRDVEEAFHGLHQGSGAVVGRIPPAGRGADGAGGGEGTQQLGLARAEPSGSVVRKMQARLEVVARSGRHGNDDEWEPWIQPAGTRKLKRSFS